MALQNSNFKNFIPAIWEARLLSNLDKNLVALNMVNRDYEGNISSYGDTVHINSVGNIAIKEYDGSDIDAPEELTSTQQTLLIDQAKYWHVQVKDVDAVQANLNLVDTTTERASYAMAEAIDTDLFAVMTAGAGIKVGTASSPIEVTPDNAYELLVDLSVKLNEKNVLKSNRKLVLPPFFVGMLQKDARFNKNENVLLNGVVGSAAGFSIIESNNLKSTSTYTAALAGNTDATSFASQLSQTEAYRPERNFADNIKGMVLYGRKVVQPDQLAVFYIKPSASSYETTGA